MRLGRLIARLIIGGLFVGHGTQKLFGWFDGPGPEGTEQMMDKLDMHPPKEQALLASWSETAGGALLAVGFLTPLAAASLIGTMVTAIRKVHLQNGPWVTNSGYEYNLVLIAALVAIMDAGPGRPSLDNALGIEARGHWWMFATLAAGAAGSAVAIEAGGRIAEAAHEDAKAGTTPAAAPGVTANA